MSFIKPVCSATEFNNSLILHELYNSEEGQVETLPT